MYLKRLYTTMAVAVLAALSLHSVSSASSTSPEELNEAKVQYDKAIAKQAELNKSIDTRVAKICLAQSQGRNRAVETLREQVKLLQIKLDSERFIASRLVAVHGDLITEPEVREESDTSSLCASSSELAWRSKQVRIARKIFIRDLRKSFHF
jgi:hypothetical protein